MAHIGVEASAVSVLKRAVEYDQQSRYTSALVCYQEGIQLLLDVLKCLYRFLISPESQNLPAIA